jgi:hypothetical protein
VTVSSKAVTIEPTAQDGYFRLVIGIGHLLFPGKRPVHAWIAPVNGYSLEAKLGVSLIWDKSVRGAADRFCEGVLQQKGGRRKAEGS